MKMWTYKSRGVASLEGDNLVALTVFMHPKSGLIREVASLEGDNLVAFNCLQAS
jgi:hypothetical protein